MVAVFVGVYFLTSLIGLYLVFPMLGLREGDILLFAHSIGGWVAAVAGWLLLAAGPVTGVVLAARALRLGARASAWVAFALNALVTLFVAYTVFDEIRMAYFPQFTFPFSG
jgi:pimeloyl-ACP methyl ester carboxylesterase